MLLLIWHGKHGNMYWVAEEVNIDSVFLAMFKTVDEEGYYTDLDGSQKTAYEKAKEGDKKAATWLIKYRKNHDYEYEDFDLEKAIQITE